MTDDEQRHRQQAVHGAADHVGDDEPDRAVQAATHGGCR